MSDANPRSYLNNSLCASYEIDADWANRFLSPSASFRGKPFWSWNGKLNRSELLRQIQVVKDMGMGGFFMHSRTGLQTTYLGSRWMRFINACADKAQAKGLESWIYDEDRWPSGSAGGIVTADSRYRMRYLRVKICTLDELKTHLLHEKEPIAVFSAQIKDLHLARYHPLHLGSGELPELCRDEKLLLFTNEEMAPHSFYNGNTYLNTLDRKATNQFLASTHERYRIACGERFGHSIKGFFTDEPNRGFVMCDRNEQGGPPNPAWVTPWTTSLPRAFRQRFGYDLIERLPELFFRLNGSPVSAVKWHYMELLQTMFLENWAKPIHNWCLRHNLLLTGHVLHEDSLVAQAVPCGSMLRYYEHMDIPGVDVLNNGNRNYWIVKQVASVARQQGREWCLSELYGCTGWQLNFAGHKEIGDWQALLGINIRCHHLSWYSMAGEAKRDYPGSIFFQSAWYKEYRYVEDYFARLHVALHRGEAECEILVVHPVESLWARIHAGWATWLTAKGSDLKPIERKFRQVCLWLLGAQIDFDYGDEEHLSRFGRVKRTATGPQLEIKQAAYKVIVVAGLETMRRTTLELLRQFKQAGGKVVFAGPPPAFLEAIPSALPSQFSEMVYRAPLRRVPLIATLRLHACPRLQVRSSRNLSKNPRILITKVRRHRTGWTIAILNTDPAAPRNDLRIQFSGQAKQVTEWDPRTGKRFDQVIRRTKGNLVWQTNLAALGERLFVVSTRRDQNLKSRQQRRILTHTQAAGPFAYDLNEPNFLVLDMPEWSLNHGSWQPSAEVLSVDGTLRSRLGIPQRTGVMIQPWARQHHRNPKKTPLALRYRFNLKNSIPSDLKLMMEQPERWTVTCNGQPLVTKGIKESLIDPCLRIIPLGRTFLHPGENLLECHSDFHDGIDLEACYLLGTFGVFFEEKITYLGPLPRTLNIGDVASQGLPFYTGRIRYHVPIPPSVPTDHANCTFSVPRWGGAVAKVRVKPEQKHHMLAFPPYEAELGQVSGEIICEICLTRRNLFGPLHLVPKSQVAITPEHFRTKSRAFTRKYQLSPSGLLARPKFTYWLPVQSQSFL